MVLDRRKIIWLAYLDCSIPRRLGRRLPRDLCIDRPSIDEILRACKELNLDCEADNEARYPRTWYLHQGRVLISYEGPKLRLLKEIASVIRRLRSSGSK